MVKLVVIAGPTAVGKSDAALKVALALEGEIINADSIQLYRHFDVGSAKPSAEARALVPHHLIDILSPDERFSLWDYNGAAREAIRDVASRGKLPIICGGTGLYIKAVLENLDGGVKGNDDLRTELSKLTNDELHGRLAGLNPEAARKIHPNDTYRLIRGIENSLLPPTGSRNWKSEYDAAYFVLSSAKSAVYERIGARVDKMFESGWVEEVRNLLGRGYSPDCKPFKSVGYWQIMKFLAGETPPEKLADEVKKSSRNYAKRQMTWFHAVKDSIRLEAAEDPAGQIIRIMTTGR
ncbi:MAG: tRNA (adenosine(37)-N6)-dimethylallyltransferase MiaA [Nitrospinae bacterium]|nr:tRNA (adenosine(37)-N6)-dimethylallyltransferase MiaA [Nitrospinota bacterium]